MRYNIRGNFGRLVVDETGKILERHDNGDPEDNYNFIARFNVREFIRHYGAMFDTDILTIGYWTKNGQYEPPELDFRKAA